MTEIDLIQATTGWINLAYTAAQWWVTVTTAMVLAVYFAAKHIAPWLFTLIVLLYLLTAISVMFEFSEYGALAFSYGMRVTQLRLANHELGANAEPSAVLRFINGWTNYAIIAIGTTGAIAFSYVHWRKARTI